MLTLGSTKKMTQQALLIILGAATISACVGCSKQPAAKEDIHVIVRCKDGKKPPMLSIQLGDTVSTRYHSTTGSYRVIANKKFLMMSVLFLGPGGQDIGIEVGYHEPSHNDGYDLYINTKYEITLDVESCLGPVIDVEAQKSLWT
jgi:hypothetical protein